MTVGMQKEPARDGRARRHTRGGDPCWRKDPAGRRERVLAEAARLFAERGYGAVTTGMIASAAGVAEGNVFHYFGSKQNLLREAGARWGREFAHAMFDGIEPAAGAGVLEAMVRRAFAFVEGSHAGFGLFLLSGDPSLGPAVHQANRNEVTGAVEAVLRDWSERGVARVSDAAVVAHLLFGMMEAALRATFHGPAPDDPSCAERKERYVRELVTAMTRMLEPVG